MNFIPFFGFFCCALSFIAANPSLTSTESSTSLESLEAINMGQIRWPIQKPNINHVQKMRKSLKKYKYQRAQQQSSYNSPPYPSLPSGRYLGPSNHKKGKSKMKKHWKKYYKHNSASVQSSPTRSTSSAPSSSNKYSHYPHQYSMQIRMGTPGEKPEKLIRKDDEQSHYRTYSHQEEEHWHDKKWINIGLNEIDDYNENNNLQYKIADRKFTTIPVYVRPIKHGATIKEIRRHFAIPTKSFPVNKQFSKWIHSPVKFSYNNCNGPYC